MKTPALSSRLAPFMSGLIEQKRALGNKYETQARYLELFDQLCAERFPDEYSVTKTMMDVWIAMNPLEHPGTLRSRITVIVHLSKYMCALGHEAYIFPKNHFPKEPKYIPYIFPEDELRRLFRQIDCCHFSPEAPNRHLIMPLLFRFMYCCGLRPGEPLHLKVEDVNLSTGVLLIRESKYDNDRYVPLSTELTEQCREYAKQVHSAGTAHQYFFPSRDGGKIPSMNIYTNFRRFLWQAGIPHGGKGKGPRPYDFRHTFAVHCLKRMILTGKDLGVYHQVLKTYMGHSFFKYTAYYLRLTKDMFPDIRQKIEALYETILSGSGGEANG